jgi:hypothetical protein
MRLNNFFKIRLLITAIIAIATWSLLAWDYYHSGVPTHHILHREDLPAISNWWGGLLLPLLAWFLLYRVQKRLMREHPETSKISALPLDRFYGLAIALSFGILLSISFAFGYDNVSGYMFFALFILALFWPIYRAECLLGLVIGMTFTFGAVLPTAFGALLVLVSAVLYLYVRPLILYIASRFRRVVSSNKGGPAKPF